MLALLILAHIYTGLNVLFAGIKNLPVTVQLPAKTPRFTYLPSFLPFFHSFLHIPPFSLRETIFPTRSFSHRIFPNDFVYFDIYFVYT